MLHDLSALNNNYIKVMEVFTNEFGEITINYDTIPDNEKENIINNFKKRNKYPSNKLIEIQDVINIKNFSLAAIANKKYKLSFLNNFDKSLLDFKLNDKNIISKLYVSYERKQKIYKKSIYYIMTNEMEINLILNYFLEKN